MITLEQIRLLESKITRALDLIRVLKEENSTLRKGLESAQRRMRELETLVDGFKTDQKEIESVIVRTLHNLDELEESAAASAGPATPATPATAGGISAGGISAGSAPTGAEHLSSVAPAAPSPKRAAGAGAVTPSAALAAAQPAVAAVENDAAPPSPKEELDIF